MKLHLTGCILLMMLISVVSDPVAAQSTPLRGPKGATTQYSGAVFGPIDANDTLWRVASRYRQNPNFSVYQVMLAIYELNPESFEQENLNLMVDGATLKLPSERYIARIDKEKARLRAEADDAAFARMTNQPVSSAPNVKPAVPLVNQDDLTQTKTQIEQQLNQIDQSQARQFEELRNQFAASIDSVQALLDDNRKLYERIDQINQDLSALRSRVDDEVEVKVDEQLVLLRELKELQLSDRAAKEAEEANSLMKTLTSPMAMIAGSGLLMFLLVAGFIVWLMKRKSSGEEAVILPPKDVVDEPDGGIADLSTALETDFGTDELSDEELFNDDDLLDDVLSNELEESLREDDSFADLNDDMLVPEDQKDDLFEEGDSALDQDDLDSLFDDEFSNDDDGAIDLSDDDTFSSDDSDGQDDLSDLTTDDDVDFGAVDEQTSDEELAALLEDPQKVYQSEETSSLAADQDSAANTDDDLIDVDDIDSLLAAEQPQTEPEDDEVPEISIDDLLAENTLSEEDKASLPVKDGPVGDEMLEKLDDEITQQSQALDRLTDSLISEIEQIEMMGDLASELDEEDDDSDILDDLLPDVENNEETESKLKSIDDITDDLDEIDFDDIENAEAFDDPLSDELLAELEAELPEEAESDAVGSEDEITQAYIAEEDISDEDIEAELNDDLTDELLQELEGEFEDAQPDDSVVDADQAIADSDAEDDFDDDELTRELLSELEADTSQSEQAPTQVTDEDEESLLDDALTEELLAELGDADDNDESIAAQDEQAGVTDVDETASEVPEHEEIALEPQDDSDDAFTADESLELEPVSEQPVPDQAMSEDERDQDSEVPAESSEAGLALEPQEETAEPALSQSDENADPLAQALADFDKQLMDDIPSLSGGYESTDVQNDDIDDDILEQALEDFDNEIDSFELEQEQDGVVPDEKPARPASSGDVPDELDDVPGLDDWLNVSDNDEETAILNELDNSEFDDLLGAIGSDDDQAPEEKLDELKLDNPDLDLKALFTDESADEIDSEGDASAPASLEEDFVDVETLMAEADDVPENEDERDLDLDVSLSEYSGISDDDDVFDIDKDAGQNANLDLARVYIEMDDYEAAKELLEEVIEKGSEAQQKEASDLIVTLV